jgi:methionyl-tRNA synthetase
LISIEDFNKLELKVAEIISAEKIEGTNKLLKLQVDIGGETRQLVAGIAQFYSSEDLPGKQIIVLVNLNKVKIKGVESEGMLLAATSEENLRLLTVDGAIPSGAKIS